MRAGMEDRPEIQESSSDLTNKQEWLEAVDEERENYSTCFPLALKMPAVIAEFPSKTWNKATNGRIDATRATTSELSC